VDVARGAGRPGSACPTEENEENDDMKTVQETAHVGYVATDAGIGACAALFDLPEDEWWTQDRDRNGRYLVLMTLTDGAEAFTPPYTARRIVEALTDRDADPAVVAEIEGICAAMVVAGLLEVRPVVVDEAPEGVAP
jgi:hypothetical protein